MLVHVLHPRPHARDLVVTLDRHVGAADVRETLGAQGAKEQWGVPVNRAVVRVDGKGLQPGLQGPAAWVA